MTAVRARDGADAIARWDRLFEALSAAPRRRLLGSLREAPPARPVALPDAAAPTGAPVDRDALRLHLRHGHLPLLSDYGYVRWQDDPFRARRGPAFDDVAAVVDALYAAADEIPDRLIRGCRRLDRERRRSTDG